MMHRALSIPLWLVLACGGAAKTDTAKRDAAGKSDAAGKGDAADKAGKADAKAVDPSLHDGYYKLCNAAELSGVATHDNGAQAMELAQWIQREVTSQPVLDLLSALAGMHPSEKGPRLRAAAKAAGVEPCPLADAP